MTKSNYFFCLLFFPFLAFSQAKVSLITPAMDSLFYQKDSLPSVQGQLVNYIPTTHKSLSLSYQVVVPVKTLPFEAALYLGQGTDAATFVATLQNAFPGKALILDVWATWCKPCIIDMEKSKAKKELLKELPLEIIYLAISDGSSQQKWEQTIANLAVSGQHIYIKKDLTTALLKQFNLFGYPSYIFIDKDGNWDTNFVRSIAKIDLDKIRAKL